MPEPGIPGQGVPGPSVPGAPGIPPYNPRSGDTQTYEAQQGGATAAGGTPPPTTPGGVTGTPGEDPQRPADPA
jgi:hypothetical protein